ncbi:MAG: phytanoyl-CoA dioxygenase family protein [Candidatus Poribacteria bacterium]|nr:phytanoyl-CoA dioxygenase family protein [Candidatus Poribacteria bacterium]
MLTLEEKWFFDHHGFIILRNVVSPEDIQLMIELGKRWHDMNLEELPPPLTSTSRSGNASPTIAHWINNVQYGDKVFQRLVLNIEIMRVIIALTRAAPCVVDCALTKNYTTSDDINFHASGQDYSVENDEPRAGFINAGTSLVDVPEGTGFVCLPGSHKRNFDPPENLSIYDGPPTVINVPVHAGDCVIFTEALYHGGRRWTAEYPRFTVFNRYIDNGSHNRFPIESHKHLISDEVYELEQPAVQGQKKQVVQRIIKDLESTHTI